MELSSSDIIRFWSKVNKTDTCWEWTPPTQRGYGQFSLNGTQKRPHRVSYILQYGPIPEGLLVCHKCDNRKCVRPDHLFLGTPLDNHRDRNSKNRQAKGSKHGRSKLTEEQVVSILNEYISGNTTSRRLARKYGITKTSILYILNKKNWSHL